MSRKIGGWARVALASCALIACTREPKSEAVPDAGAASASVARFAATAPKQRGSPEPPRERRRWHGRGAAGSLLGNLRGVDLSEQQKSAVSAIEAELRGGRDPWRVQGELAQALAAEVRAGKIDKKKLEPQLKIAREAATEEKARQAKALNTLHATLDEAQRKTLVATARARQERASRRSSFAAKTEDSPKGPNARRAKRELERLTTELSLEPAQKEKLEKILAQSPGFAGGPRDGQATSAALLDAFEKLTFDAQKLELDQNGEDAFNQRVEYLKKLTAMLTAEQRDKLATSLIERSGFDHNRKPHPDRETEADDYAPQADPAKP
jgi:Spy/CpxP family protein refolding chaperone